MGTEGPLPASLARIGTAGPVPSAAPRLPAEASQLPGSLAGGFTALLTAGFTARASWPSPGPSLPPRCWSPATPSPAATPRPRSSSPSVGLGGGGRTRVFSVRSTALLRAPEPSPDTGGGRGPTRTCRWDSTCVSPPLPARGGTLISLRWRHAGDAAGLSWGPSAAATSLRVDWTFVMCTGEPRAGRLLVTVAVPSACATSVSRPPAVPTSLSTGGTRLGAGSRRQTEVQWMTSGDGGVGSPVLSPTGPGAGGPRVVPKQRL